MPVKCKNNKKRGKTMNATKVKTSDVKSIINATFPNYKKKAVWINCSGAVTFNDLNWSGGTRMQFRSCTIDGKSVESKIDMNAYAPWNNPIEGKRVEIPAGFVVVESGHFCGQEATIIIHCTPADMPKMIQQ